MSPSDLPIDLVAVSDEVDRCLKFALVKGASGIPRLIDRLQALGAPTPSNWIAVEAQVWSASIDEELNPDVGEVVVGVLRSAPNGRWLDATARRQNNAAALDAVATGAGVVRLMLQRHLASGSVGHLRDALSALESITRAYWATISAAPAPGECPEVTQLLGRSLDAGLQSVARSIFVANVRERVDGVVGNRMRRDRDREDDQWLSRASWTQYDAEEVTETRVVFTGTLQARYEAAAEEAERVRRARVLHKEKQDAERAAWEARGKAEQAAADRSAGQSSERTDRTREAGARPRDGLAARLRREIDPTRLRNPESLATMPLEELLVVKQDLDRDARHDPAKMQEEANRKWYAGRIGRPYEPRYYARDPFE